jgi:hypothetical protein
MRTYRSGSKLSTGRSRSGSATGGIAAGSSLIVLVVILRLLAGAYRVELGTFGRVRPLHERPGAARLLTHAFGQNPFTFAGAYYLSCPKIAPLMWPPFFHGALGLFCCPDGLHPRRVLPRDFAAWTAFRLSACVSRFGSTVSGWWSRSSSS